MMMQGGLSPLGSGTMRVELDKKALFALASDTRLEILRALQPMRRTVTQLAEALGLDKAAVHRHLQKLVDGGLASRDEDHGFVYYGLSWKARDLLAPNENTKIIVHLAAFFWLVMGATAAAAVAGSRTVTWIYHASEGGNVTAAGDPWVWPSGGGTWEAITSPASPLWFVLAVLLAAVAVVAGLLAWRALRGPRQKPGPGDAAEAPSA